MSQNLPAYCFVLNEFKTAWKLGYTIFELWNTGRKWQWKRKLKKLQMLSWSILEVSLNLHDCSNEYPPMPEQIKVNNVKNQFHFGITKRNMFYIT